ncbi:hypothetical protein CEXT_97861 [Caerostris extrusa]|uniref:Uncharacterized protein n=1 Tax=Caerostris extrusa TaxID=172846 RepID=A0AAV4NRB1_CAEEX|nr:hypothetical protein CEXT_97861 [Caerostris extrusa]
MSRKRNSVCCFSLSSESRLAQRTRDADSSDRIPLSEICSAAFRDYGGNKKVHASQTDGGVIVKNSRVGKKSYHENEIPSVVSLCLPSHDLHREHVTPTHQRENSLW